MIKKYFAKFLYTSVIMVTLVQCGGDGKGVDSNGIAVEVIFDTTYMYAYDTAKFTAMFNVLTSTTGKCNNCHQGGVGSNGTLSKINGMVAFNVGVSSEFNTSIFSVTEGNILAYKKASYEDATVANVGDLVGKNGVQIARVQPKAPVRSSLYLRVLGNEEFGNAGSIMPLGASIPVSGLPELVADWINSIDQTVTVDTIQS